MKKEIFKIKDIDFRDDVQEQVLKFILKVLKSFNEKDFIERREMVLFVHKSASQEYVPVEDLKSFKSSVERWLRTKYLKFSEQEINYLKAKTSDFKNNQDTKGWLLFCLTVDPKQEPPKEKRLIFNKKESVKENIKVDFEF